jgi:hypothetical protein
MRKIQAVMMSIALLVMQPVFADTAPSDSSKDQSCSVIASACLNAGFVKTESADKQIWHDCMKPIILGKTVAGVTIDSSVVKACRSNKIQELKSELKEMQNS